MESSRTNFKSMFLISETYLDQLKNKATETEQNLEMKTDNIEPSNESSVTEPSRTNDLVSASTSLSDDEWTPNDEKEESTPNLNEEKEETTTTTTTTTTDTVQEPTNVDKIEDGQYKSIEDKVNSFNCPICKEGFETEEDMLVHKTKYHPVHECKLCERTFKNKRELDEHITQTHEFGNRYFKQTPKRRREEIEDGEPIKRIKFSKREREEDSEEPVKKIKFSMKNKRRREIEEDDDDYNEPNKRIKLRNRNKRSREENEDNPNAKKVKIQLKNVPNIEDIRTQEIEEQNKDIAEQYNVNTTTYNTGTIKCKVCQREFDSLYAYRDHEH